MKVSLLLAVLLVQLSEPDVFLPVLVANIQGLFLLVSVVVVAAW